MWAILLLATAASAQIWTSGDNSTVAGCRADCSTTGTGDLPCWQDSLSFFEEKLITQLRHYIANQVDIDQWHRRHGMPGGQDFDKVTKQIEKDFGAQLKTSNEEVLESTVVKKIADTVADRVKDIATHSMNKVPLYQCPLPCDYSYDMYQTLFITSMVLNGFLAISIIPAFIRSLRSEDDSDKEPLRSTDNS